MVNFLLALFLLLNLLHHIEKLILSLFDDLYISNLLCFLKLSVKVFLFDLWPFAYALVLINPI
jgi:hypothetical protein